jgi:mRNA-degrading endonuclease YafQ of YafQ-DinJ toxin-antitoxin module
MAEVYAFAKDMDLLSAAKKHLEDTVTTIVQQTAKCAIFVREYTGHGFLGRWLGRSCLHVIDTLSRQTCN